MLNTHVHSQSFYYSRCKCNPIPISCYVQPHHWTLQMWNWVRLSKERVIHIKMIYLLYILKCHINFTFPSITQWCPVGLPIPCHGIGQLLSLACVVEEIVPCLCRCLTITCTKSARRIKIRDNLSWTIWFSTQGSCKLNTDQVTTHRYMTPWETNM